MSDAETMQSGPGIVAQRSWKPLGFLPPDVQKWMGWFAKGSLAVFSHNFYDLAILNHVAAPMPNLLTAEGLNQLPEYLAKPEIRGFYASKLGGELGNRVFNIGGMNIPKDYSELLKETEEKDDWGAYLSRKIIPGVLYCALLGAFYGTAFPAALTSFIITTAMTDTVYKVLGEGLLGLPHIKS